MIEYAKIVAKAQRTAAELGKLSPLEHWREAVKEAGELVAGIKGVRGNDEARRAPADHLERTGANPMLYKAVVSPDANEPPVAMVDVKEMYRKERMEGHRAQSAEPTRPR